MFASFFCFSFILFFVFSVREFTLETRLTKLARVGLRMTSAQHLKIKNAQHLHTHSVCARQEFQKLVRKEKKQVEITGKG
jgi:organic hydroperoxide reductase OsmC/OhrA